jgi:phage N-6-adenine-methyltransferase
MNMETQIAIDLKSELDRIDKEVFDFAYNGYLNSRVRVLVSMWEKGKIIASQFTGGKMRSWNQLAEETGRRDVSLKRWHEIYLKYPNKEDYIKAEAEPKALQWTQKAINGPTVGKGTGDNESYTPQKYIDKAKNTMGDIDLDPASNDLAQETVNAKDYYTEDDNGLLKSWSGNIWLNPPYENKLISQFVNKIVTEPISQAIILTNNNTDTQWFKKLVDWSDLVCFTTGRINFYKNDGSTTSPTNGQVFFYKGDNTERFVKEFGDVGLMMKKL